MSLLKIGTTIKNHCENDKNLEGLLLDLVNFENTGKKWYKEEYRQQIEKYAVKGDEHVEDK